MKFVDFLKKYRKILGLILLVVLTGVLIITQVKFLSPESVKEESSQYIAKDFDDTSYKDDPQDVVQRDADSEVKDFIPQQNKILSSGINNEDPQKEKKYKE